MDFKKEKTYSQVGFFISFTFYNNYMKSSLPWKEQRVQLEDRQYFLPEEIVRVKD